MYERTYTNARGTNYTVRAGAPKASGGGIGFFGLLTITFIVLRLTGVIDWSWWLVLSPLAAPVVLVIAAAILVALGTGIYFLVTAVLEAIENKKNKRRRARHQQMLAARRAGLPTSEPQKHRTLNEKFFSWRKAS